jgi:hypothetical protein
VVCDLPGFAGFADQLPSEKQRAGSTRWWGGMAYQQSVAALRYGDMAGVAASDKLLAEMETLVPVSQSWRAHNSVVGMRPNVPQYLAGNPYNMRLKRRCATATAPLSIRRIGRKCGHKRLYLPQAWCGYACIGAHAGEP